MTRKREKMQAYFAGIIDGEGTICITRQVGKVSKNGDRWNPTYVASVSVTMCDPRAVGLLFREYPEGYFAETGVTSTGRPKWEFRLTQNAAYQFLVDIKPYLIIKHEQSKVALSFLVYTRKMRATPGWNASEKPMSYWHRLEDLYQKCRALNGATKGVNSVNLLLDHEMRQYRSKRDDVEQDVRTILGRLEGVETTAEASTSR